MDTKEFGGSWFPALGRHHLHHWDFLSDQSVFINPGGSLDHTWIMLRRWLRVGVGHARKTNQEGWDLQPPDLHGRGGELEMEAIVWPLIQSTTPAK